MENKDWVITKTSDFGESQAVNNEEVFEYSKEEKKHDAVPNRHYIDILSDSLDFRGCDELYSKSYGKVYNTGYRWDVPYIINLDKFNEKMKKYNKITALTTNVVRFSCNITRAGGYWLHMFGSEHESVVFHSFIDKEGDFRYADFVKFIKDVISNEVIICSSDTELNKIIDEKLLSIDKLNDEIEILKNA